MTAPAYIAIDLKSFYASVECADRKLDPLTTNLVVADEARTEKTICLAVSPALKACGLSGRPRLFEVVQKVRDLNRLRLRRAPGRKFSGKSASADELAADPALELDYVVAVPRMGRYMEVSSQIYGIYLRYVAPEHIHVYSIDEVFIDAAPYLKMYKLAPRGLAMRIIRDVLAATGITATAGIGTNLYLAKIAMDIVAKHIPADGNGVRIAELDERSYREKLWTHRPLTDFWRIGRGYASRLEARGMRTMGDIARMSVKSEDTLYNMFGVNAELLIDHAWGWEPVTIADIKSYRPESSSLSSGQVLQEPYECEKARLVAKEMADLLTLDLAAKRLAADQIVLTVGYDASNLADPERRRAYAGPVSTDHYGRATPKAAHGSENLGGFTSSSKRIVAATERLFDRIVDPALLVRRMYVVANHVIPEEQIPKDGDTEQRDLFVDYEELERRRIAEDAEREREARLQRAVIDIKRRMGKNAILKGMDLLDGATAKERNQQIGGHKK